MADKKWLLGPGPLDPMPLGMNCKPWYRDKLPSKCFTMHKKTLLKFPTSLDSRRWIFVKEGLDDFRKGCPPCDNLITRGPKEGFLPVIAPRVPKHAPKKSQKKLPKEADLFSTLSPAQLARKAFVANIEACLTKHPLALYPNLEEDLPADLLLKVLGVLDPDRKLEDTWAYCQGPREKTKSPQKLRKKRPAKVYLEPLKAAPVSHPASLHHEDKKSSRKDSLTHPPIHRKVPKGIPKFCRCVATFGDLGVNEEFMKLCEVSCERPPKGTQVSSNVKYSMGLNKMEEIKFSMEEQNWERKLQKPSNSYKPSWVKMRYGAWYLKPKLWKKVVNDEPWIDPNVLLEDGTFGRKLTEPDILEDLYGTIAFKDFILSKDYRMPDMLEKLFIRKGWQYDSVRTPIYKVIKNQLQCRR
ncbi:protein FAM47E-like [Hippopotamus amphibius kiboko]|uniref:protein FAM47E-like n=1 Tax=Hippopotamus amphibius kiboko TaxID=575201 RepID=UPI00259380A1|nr:protein FAM47E-like [Hippopotamus amphibius kiboko]